MKLRLHRRSDYSTNDEKCILTQWKTFSKQSRYLPTFSPPLSFSINLFDGVLERSIQISKMNTIVQSWYKASSTKLISRRYALLVYRNSLTQEKSKSRDDELFTTRRMLTEKISNKYSTSEKNFELHHCCGERAMSMPRIDVKNNTLKMRRKERRKEEPLKIDESRGRKKLSRRSTQNSRSSSEGSKTGARLEKRTGDERGAAREWNCARVKRPSARQPTYESGQLTPSNDTDVHRPDCV